MTASPLDLARTIREVHRTGSTAGVLLRRTFGTDVPALWQSLTDPVILARWLGELQGDPADGPVVLALGGGGHLHQVEVLRCRPPSRLEVLWSSGDEPPTVVWATVGEHPDGAELTLEHFAFTRATSLGYGPGWEELFVDLAGQLGQPVGHDCVALEQEAEQRWADAPLVPDPRWGSLTADTYRLVRRFPAAVEQVWAALTTPAGLRGWFGELSGELRVGGTWRVVFEDGSVSGRVSACRPQQSLRTTFVQAIDDPATATHEVGLELVPVAEGTEVTLVHHFAVAAPAGTCRGMAAGWSAYLTALERAFAGAAAEEEWLADYRTAALVLRPAEPGA